MNLDLIILLLVIISLYKIKLVRKSDADYENYLSPERSNAIKGILAYMVVCYHLAQYLTNPECSTSIYRGTTQNGYLYVCFFFFYSGFGLMKKRIGNPTYMEAFFSRRVLPILFTYALVHIVYILAYAIVGGGSTLVEAFMSLIHYGATYVPHTWFILAIVAHYIFFWLISRAFKNRFSLYVLGSTVCYLVYVFLCRKANYPMYWYDSCSTFVLGIFWAYKEEAIFDQIKRSYISLFLPVTICFILLYVLRGQILTVLQGSVLSALFFGILCILFTSCITLLSVKLCVNNKILQFFGKLSLTLYLVHGMFVSVFNRILWEWIPQEFLRCAVALALSILTAVCYRKFEAAMKHLIKRCRSVRPAN